ncbi:RNA deprotection pyrophosphohydrolase [Bacillus sp. S/N-304-OC-R1]|uniref:RNA deprotection pyrophosphohydrolase n=1 Tax=Bacillus sp. S/N-304-OC-R1 TaxID=2758034 RepID=UPI001C8F0BB7|nr:nucleoside triphosphatase YtkD [Bacillus sp. S/N-304-OC-R1]MBY0122849.1 nucleoside triphosphatase YtkD [Bacillus sp. S/N-304-OC-R1]
MKRFKDINGGMVKLSFMPHSFNCEPEHVLVICKMGEKWLLTNHSKRGLEFPGGKVERDETLEEAARREVMEETGASIKKLQLIGEYEVTNEAQTFVKAIFFASIARIEDKEDYFETAGPVLIDGDILEKRWEPQFSFIMQDEVIYHSIHRISDIH